MSKTVNQHSEETPNHAKQMPRSVNDIDELAEAPLERRQQVQAMLDTSARTSSGIYVYVALWLIVSLLTGLSAKHPVLVGSFSAWLKFNALYRVLLGRSHVDFHH